MAERVIIKHAGGRLRFETFESPKLQEGQVRIDVAASGINFADVGGVALGRYEPAKRLGWPITPGMEVAGTVSAVGPRVKEGLEVGKRVLAATLFGGYSSEATVNASSVRPVPSGMSLVEAASIPLGFVTADHATDLTNIRPGDRALVHSVSGGTGLTLIQALKAKDCQVVGVVGLPEKVQIAKDYGADEVIVKSKQDRSKLWREAERLSPNGYNLVFDPTGVELEQSYEHTAPKGFLVMYGFHEVLQRGRKIPNPLTALKNYRSMPHFEPPRLVAENRGIVGFNVGQLWPGIFEERIDHVLANFENGTSRLLPITPYPIEEADRAYRDMRSGTTTGKLVLTME